MAKVIREDHTGVMSIKAKHLVPGDIVEVSSMFFVGTVPRCITSCLLAGEYLKHLGVLIYSTIQC